MNTTNRSDYTWPYLAERRMIFDWDRFEYRRRDRDDCLLSLSRDLAKSNAADHLQNLGSVRLDLPLKEIVGRHPSAAYYPPEKMIEYDKYKAATRSTVWQTGHHTNLKSPQINLHELSADNRDAVCGFLYCTTKNASELTAGVPDWSGPTVPVDLPLKPFGDPGKFRPQPLYETIKPAKNWRRVSIEWDELQRRIFGGRSID